MNSYEKLLYKCNRQRRQLKKLMEKNKKRKDTINKAIEYIENNLWLHFETRHDYLTVRDNLLEILGDANEK